MMLRGVRGAITVEENCESAILGATRELLSALIEANGIEEHEVASVLFTSTSDLTAAFPARAARELGWNGVALMGTLEAPVSQGLARCIRVLLHWNTDKGLDELEHRFLRGAQVLRPDLVDERLS